MIPPEIAQLRADNQELRAKLDLACRSIATLEAEIDQLRAQQLDDAATIWRLCAQRAAALLIADDLHYLGIWMTAYQLRQALGATDDAERGRT